MSSDPASNPPNTTRFIGLKVMKSSSTNRTAYVQPRTIKSNSKIGIGIPIAQSKIQPIAPFSFFKISISPPASLPGTSAIDMPELFYKDYTALASARESSFAVDVEEKTGQSPMAVQRRGSRPQPTETARQEQERRTKFLMARKIDCESTSIEVLS
jgi:hypothetical protein